MTPSFEKHLGQFTRMVDSLSTHCLDLDFLCLVVVLEKRNVETFLEVLSRYPNINYQIVHTENCLTQFGVEENPAAFLKRIGKFTFQTIKKFGGLSAAPSDWSLVLDSESIFHKSFKARDLLKDYVDRRYVFYTRTAPRGELWKNSTGYQVSRNASAALGVSPGDRWYMEYFHWFYEKSKVRDLLTRLGERFYGPIRDETKAAIDYFENILYYTYLEHYAQGEYSFIDFHEALRSLLPRSIAGRFRLDELPFSLFGNEYLLNILSPSDVKALEPLFEAYRLPFVRLEPPQFSTGYLEELKKLPSFIATVSSQHMGWLSQRIAVCVSGEFRHAVHRVPEQQLRHLVGFLSGVDCDVFVHGWNTTSEAMIIDQLKPRAYKFEPRPSFAEAARRIKNREPNIKPGRDEGSLSMFYSMEQAFELAVASGEKYDFVLRIRPDLYSELSLKEIMVRISDEGDHLPRAVYVPRHFHSKGINDQLALGSFEAMSVYCRTLSFALPRLSELFFNPEAVLLQNLVDHQVQIAAVEAPYALMRNEPFKINAIHEAFQRQFGVWWSRTDNLPQFEDLSGYFSDKLSSMKALISGDIPELLYVRGREVGNPASHRRASIRLRLVDNDPALHSLGLFKTNWSWRIGDFDIVNGAIRETAQPSWRQVFAFREGANVIVSQWRFENGRFINGRLVVGAEDVSEKSRSFGIDMRQLFEKQKRAHEHNPERRGASLLAAPLQRASALAQRSPVTTSILAGATVGTIAVVSSLHGRRSTVTRPGRARR